MVSIISIFFSVPPWHYRQLTKIKRSRNFFTHKIHSKMFCILFQLFGWLSNEVILKSSDYFTDCLQYFPSEYPVALSLLDPIIRNAYTKSVMCRHFSLALLNIHGCMCCVFGPLWAFRHEVVTFRNVVFKPRCILQARSFPATAAKGSRLYPGDT